MCDYLEEGRHLGPECRAPNLVKSVGDGQKKVVRGDGSCCCPRERYIEVVGGKGSLGYSQESGDMKLDFYRSVEEVKFGFV